MKARSVVVFAVCAVLVTAVLTACAGSSHPITPLGSNSKPGRMLFHPHRYTLNQVKAAFAAQGIPLRRMPTQYGAHVVVLFDPRWHAPTGFSLGGGGYPQTYFWVFAHGAAESSTAVQDGNVYVMNGVDERSVNAALHELDLTYQH